MTTQPEPKRQRTAEGHLGASVPATVSRAAARQRPEAPSVVKRSHQRSESRRFLGLSWPVWLLLTLAIVFLFCSRVYITRVEARLESALRPTPKLITLPQTSPVSIGDFRLSWQPVVGARDYRLHVETADGSVVLDGLTVRETDWMPPLDALAGFPAGEYLWRVEARNEAGETICRSDTESVRIQ